MHRSLQQIEKSTVFLKNADVKNEGTLHRTIDYEISRIGSDVKIDVRGPNKYMNIRIDECAQNRIFIMVPVKSVYNLPGVVLFNEDGKLVSPQSAMSLKKAYVLLAIAEKLQPAKEFGISVSKKEVDLCNKFWYNQIKTDGTFHFGTTGKIFSLGFGPKYYIDNNTNLSIGEFAEKKRNYATAQVDDKEQLKSKMFEFLHLSVNHIFGTFNRIQHTISPHISKLQYHFDLFDKEKKKGILNVHMCHNAQTKMKHTECDASYTIISVPEQEKKFTNSGRQNKAQFEFNITDDCTLLLPLESKTILVYSGFLLTHRQQIRKLNDQVDPFINIVSYNSEKLFKHLMESFRREINEKSRRR